MHGCSRGDAGTDGAAKLTRLQQMPNGLLEEELPISCSESYYHVSNAIYGANEKRDEVSFENAARYRCRSTDGSYDLDVLPNAQISIIHDFKDGPTGLQLVGIKSMSWQIFGKKYSITPKPSCTPDEADVEVSNVGVLIDTDSRALKLAVDPKKSCYVLKQI